MGFTLNQLEQERQIRKLQKTEDKDTSDYELLSNLPKINNVELKGDQTISDLGINADNVMMSDGVTSVEDALDELNNLPAEYYTRTDITSYNTIQNCYECPSDGYVIVKGNESTLSTVWYKFADSVNAYVLIEAKDVRNAIFMRKGAKIYVENATICVFVNLK